MELPGGAPRAEVTWSSGGKSGTLGAAGGLGGTIQEGLIADNMKTTLDISRTEVTYLRDPGPVKLPSSHD